MKKISILILGLCSSISYNKWNPSVHHIYGTHQPVLAVIANKTSGPIIEFGCGDSSTDLLHRICKKNKRILISIDDNLNWLDKFRKKYLGDGYETDNSGWHKFYYVAGKKDNLNLDHWINFLDTFELLKTLTFDVCFIDQDPFLARSETLNRLSDKARYIILHDCDYFPNNQIIGHTVMPSRPDTQIPGNFDFSDAFTYFKVYYPPRPWPGQTGPPTLLGSNFESDMPEVNFDEFENY